MTARPVAVVDPQAGWVRITQPAPESVRAFTGRDTSTDHHYATTGGITAEEAFAVLYVLGWEPTAPWQAGPGEGQWHAPITAPHCEQWESAPLFEGTEAIR